MKIQSDPEGTEGTVRNWRPRKYWRERGNGCYQHRRIRAGNFAVVTLIKSGNDLVCVCPCVCKISVEHRLFQWMVHGAAYTWLLCCWIVHQPGFISQIVRAHDPLKYTNCSLCSRQEVISMEHGTHPYLLGTKKRVPRGSRPENSFHEKHVHKVPSRGNSLFSFSITASLSRSVNYVKVFQEWVQSRLQGLVIPAV